MRLVQLAAAAALVIGSAGGSHPPQHRVAAPFATLLPSALPAARVVDAFHAALQRGEAQIAKSFLAEDAIIFEEGGAERSRAEYAAEHLGADAAFTKALPGRLTHRAGEAVGDMAWIASEGRTTGTYKEKFTDRVTTETMVLRRSGDGWKIVHIHWSSAAKL